MLGRSDAIGTPKCPAKSARRPAPGAAIPDAGHREIDPIHSRHVQFQPASLASGTIGVRLRNVPPFNGLGQVHGMEFTMINVRVLSTVAAMVLVAPMAAPTAGFAQQQMHSHGGGRAGGGGGAGMRPGGGHFHGGAPGPRFSGGGYRGGGGYHGGGAFVPGVVAGAIVGGALASQGGYYGGPGYYAQGYYDDQGYDDGAVAVAPGPGGDDGVSYCMQTYQSYDPQSGTYMGYDGVRHPCP
jgi:hypothetical protein